MKNVVLFTGRYSVEDPGAISIVTKNIFPLSDNTNSGTLISVGNYLNSREINEFTQVNILPEYLSGSWAIRAKRKIIKNVLSKSNCLQNRLLDIDTSLSLCADEIASRRLVQEKERNDQINIAIGLMGHSERFGWQAKALGMRYVVHSQFCHPTVQNRLISEGYTSIGLKIPRFSWLMQERSLNTLEMADLIWCPSKFVQKSHIENGIPADKTFVSYLGVDVDSYKTDRDASNNPDVKTVLFVGNVNIQKGVHVLLKALAIGNLNNINMVFNGFADEISFKLMKDYAPALKLKNISLVIDPGDPRRYFKKAALFVSPSIHDAFGLVVLEAMSAGLPIIVSDHVGASEVIMHKKNGYIFKSDGSEELANYIELLLNNSSIMETFGRVSKSLSESYHIKNIAKQIAARFSSESEI
jgi:glycosyltransferase involved in cell wall biosynthesis